MSPHRPLVPATVAIVACLSCAVAMSAERRPLVVVMPLAVTGASAETGRLLEGVLVEALRAGAAFDVARAVGRLPPGSAVLACAELACANEAATAMGADYLLRGALAKTEVGFTFSLHLVDPSKNVELRTEAAFAGDEALLVTAAAQGIARLVAVGPRGVDGPSPALTPDADLLLPAATELAPAPSSSALAPVAPDHALRFGASTLAATGLSVASLAAAAVLTWKGLAVLAADRDLEVLDTGSSTARRTLADGRRDAQIADGALVTALVSGAAAAYLWVQVVF